MAEKRLRAEEPAVYVATGSFYIGGTTLVLEGHTVAAGHPILRGRKALFRPFEPTWPLSRSITAAATPVAPEPEPEPEPAPEPEPEATT